MNPKSMTSPGALHLDRPVPDGGYAWWYLDALSPDGRFGLTVIAFVGCVFSPYYFAARAKGPAEAEAFCALNVCLYLPGARAWTLTERGRGAVSRGPDRLAIGPSELVWDGCALTVRFREVTSLARRPVTGEITAAPAFLSDAALPLDPAGAHRWRPICTDVEVRARVEGTRWTDEPWTGRGYLDANWGERALEADFRSWSWSRATPDADGRSAIDYDTVLADGARVARALSAGPLGVGPREGRAVTRHLPPTLCGLSRPVHATRARLVSTFEDTPFYARSGLMLDGRPAMHETLSLTRFASGAMQWMLPYRIKRVG